MSGPEGKYTRTFDKNENYNTLLKSCIDILD